MLFFGRSRIVLLHEGVPSLLFAAQFVDAPRVYAPFVPLEGWAKVRLFVRVVCEDVCVACDDVFSSILVSYGGLRFQLVDKTGAMLPSGLADAVIIAALGVLRAR